jgi:predicted small secreted protein
MIILKKRLAVLALGLAVTSLASPSYAQGAGGDISAARAAALQQCSYFNDSDWDYAYRACMAQHGQQE